MRRLWLVVMLAVQGQALTLAELERMAVAASPGVAQSQSDVRAAAGRALQAGLYPNPVLGASGDHVAGGPILRGGDLGMFVEQRVVVAGKLGLQRKAAEQSHVAAGQMQEAERLRVLTTIRGLYYRALGEQRLVAVRQDMAELAGRTAKTRRELANLGQADRPDVLAADIEAQRAELGVTMARNALDKTWREIAVVVGQAGLQASTLDGDFEAVPRLDAEAALAAINAGNPELLAADANRAGADLQLRRARVENIPDILVRGGVRYNRELIGPGEAIGTEGFFDIGVQIPIFNRNQGAIVAAGAEAERARLEGSRERLALARRFAGAYREYKDAMDAAVRYRDSMIPAAREAYEMYVGNFANMAAPYPQVLATQRNLFQLQEEYVAALMTAWRSAVEIEGLLVME
ncbi:MAG TPA: TolC family protein [Bryobacteraceae bacterium]|nr:TolC family protein [Bryobacteraceae bacterium]